MPAGRGKRNQDRVRMRKAMPKAHGSTDTKCHLACNDTPLHTSEFQMKLQQAQQMQQAELLQQQPQSASSSITRIGTDAAAWAVARLATNAGGDGVVASILTEVDEAARGAGASEHKAARAAVRTTTHALVTEALAHDSNPNEVGLDLACSHWMASAHCNVSCWGNPTTPELFRQSDPRKRRTKDSERRRHHKQDSWMKGGDSTLQWGGSSSSQNGVPIGMSSEAPLNPWMQGDSPTFGLHTAHVPTNSLFAESPAATSPSAEQQQQQQQQDGKQEHERRERRPARSNKQKHPRGRRLRDQDDTTPAILVVSLHPDLTLGGMLSAPEDLTPPAVWELRCPLLPLWDDEQGVQGTLMIAEESSGRDFAGATYLL